MAIYIHRKTALQGYVERPDVPPLKEEAKTLSSSVTLHTAGQKTVAPDCAIYIPTVGCDECGDFAEKLDQMQDELDALRSLIGDKTDTVIAMTDTNNNEVSITVLAE